MRKIRLYLDHPRVGCGWRSYFIISAGRKWAKLLATDTAETITIPVADLRFGRDETYKRTRAARRLRNVAKTYGVDTEAVKEVLSALR